MRPANIIAISITLDAAPSVGVIPIVSPTVPIAEADSNKHFCSGKPSIREIAAPPTKNTVKYIAVMVIAAFTVESSKRLADVVTSSFLRSTDSTVSASNATVVVFIQPAVDPGLPPTNINMSVRAMPTSLILL